MRLFLFFLLFPVVLAAQKKKPELSGWVADTFAVYPRENPCFDFNAAHLGALVQKGKRDWWFYGENENKSGLQKLPVYFYHASPSLFDDCVYFDLSAQLVKYSETERISRSWQNSSPVSAASLRFYMGGVPMQKTYNDALVPDTVSLDAIRSYYQPFYFRKCEVTNAEYREFTKWVLDSIAMRTFAENGFADDYLCKDWDDDKYKGGNQLPPLNWKEKIRWDEDAPEYKEILRTLYLPQNERFYSRNDIDTRKLIYLFNKVPEKYSNNKIAIYPDTSSWINDFSYSYNEPMNNMYFWHPAYDHYPVVGLTYWQCMAFLEWKSKQLNQKLKKEGKKLQVTCALPSEREWDMASTAVKNEDQLVMLDMNYYSLCDNSWLTDLRLRIDTSKIVRIYKGPEDTMPRVQERYGDGIYLRENPPKIHPVDTWNPDVYTPYRDFILHDEFIRGNFISDGYFHTAPVDMKTPHYNTLRSRVREKMINRERQKELDANERHQAHYDKQTGIYYLDGNVSEWIREDLDLNWRPVYEKHKPVPKSPMFEQFLLIHSAENYFYDQLPQHGKMVRGSNWYDERYSCKFGKNTAGMNAKTFLNPDEARCTVGFRYVIYVEPVK